MNREEARDALIEIASGCSPSGFHALVVDALLGSPRLLLDALGAEQVGWATARDEWTVLLAPDQSPEPDDRPVFLLPAEPA